MLLDNLNRNKLKLWQQLKNKRKKYISFRNYLDLLADRDSFGLFMIEKFYPGLRQKIDRNATSPSNKTSVPSNLDPDFSLSGDNQDGNDTPVADDKNIYRFILHCIDPEKE